MIKIKQLIKINFVPIKTAKKYEITLKEFFDAFDNLMFSEAVKEHPDYMDGLNDFTIYTNTSSVFDSTVTSMNQMFGNCSFDNTLSLNDWLDSGWNSETTTSFYDAMHEDNYICNAYNFELSEKSYLYGRFDNVEKFDKPKSIKPEQFAIRRFTDDFQNKPGSSKNNEVHEI